MKRRYIIFLFLITITHAFSQSTIEGYEYWFNNDFANKTTTTVVSASQLLINQTISTTGLIHGINILNFRSYDNSGRYSSLLSHYFYKTSISESNPSFKIVAYQYWLDDNYAQAVLVNTPIQESVNINEMLSLSSLSSGVHRFNIRFKDNTNLWSSTVNHFFYKVPEQIVSQNLITAYRYWFNNGFANAVNVSLPPGQQINLIQQIDLKSLPKGDYEINFQFKDTLGYWSVVMSDSIEKIALPIANFSFSEAPYCDSTLVIFVDKSIDGDTYLWDFGDGKTDIITNPTHAFYTPNTYQVSLTVTDTLLDIDSTIVLPVVVNSLHTTSTLNETACDSYTAPDGQVYTTSGLQTAIIPNVAGCDSTITINLTINKADVTVTQNQLTLTANLTGAFYQWLDCNNGYAIINGETNQIYTATANGSYAVKVTQNTCIDTSDCYTIATVGVLENTFSHKIKAYPNPTYGMVKIYLTEKLDYFTVEISDINGNIINQYTYQNTAMFEINLQIQPGIYLMKIHSGNRKAILRLVKN